MNKQDPPKNSRCRLCRDRRWNYYQSHKRWMQQISTKKKTRLDSIEWGRWSTENCTWCLNLTIQTNGMCTILENETHIMLWDFETQTDYIISARQPNLVIVNTKKKENLSNSGLYHSSWPQGKTEGKWGDNYLDLARELKKLWNMKVMVILIVIGTLTTITKWMILGLVDWI